MTLQSPFSKFQPFCLLSSRHSPFAACSVATNLFSPFSLFELSQTYIFLWAHMCLHVCACVCIYNRVFKFQGQNGFSCERPLNENDIWPPLHTWHSRPRDLAMPSSALQLLRCACVRVCVFLKIFYFIVSYNDAIYSIFLLFVLFFLLWPFVSAKWNFG